MSPWVKKMLRAMLSHGSQLGTKYTNKENKGYRESRCFLPTQPICVGRKHGECGGLTCWCVVLTCWHGGLIFGLDGECSVLKLFDLGGFVGLPSVGDGEVVVGEFVVLPVIAFEEEGCGTADAPLELLTCVTAEGDAVAYAQAVEVVDELGGEDAEALVDGVEVAET